MQSQPIFQPKDGHLIVRRSSIHGRGCFSRIRLPARKKFGEFIGEKISAAEAGRRVARGGSISICEIDDRWSIDAERSGKPTAFINHSCRPNSYSRVAHGRIFFYALRAIDPGEEITLDYTPAQQPGLRCACGSPRCRGVML